MRNPFENHVIIARLDHVKMFMRSSEQKATRGVHLTSCSNRKTIRIIPSQLVTTSTYIILTKKPSKMFLNF